MQCFVFQGALCTSEICNMVFGQWLVCDLRNIGAACLPASIATQPKLLLTEPCALQVCLCIYDPLDSFKLLNFDYIKSSMSNSPKTRQFPTVRSRGAVSDNVAAFGSLAEKRGSYYDSV